eukprot:6490205-Amphidinium_carterae.1
METSVGKSRDKRSLCKAPLAELSGNCRVELALGSQELEINETSEPPHSLEVPIVTPVRTRVCGSRLYGMQSVQHRRQTPLQARSQTPQGTRAATPSRNSPGPSRCNHSELFLSGHRLKG